MAPLPRDPLSRDELAVVRAMIAEYQYDAARTRFLGTTWKRVRAVVISCAAVIVFGMQLLTVIVIVRGAK